MAHYHITHNHSHLLHAMPEYPGLGFGSGRVRLGSGFIWTWLQRAGRCADSSFVSGFLVTVKDSQRGVTARGAEGPEGYECGVGNISRQCYSITKLIYFCVLRGLLYNAADYRAGKKTTRTTRGHVCHDTLAHTSVDARDDVM